MQNITFNYGQASQLLSEFRKYADNIGELDKQKQLLANIEALALEGYSAAIFALANYYYKKQSSRDFQNPKAQYTILFWMTAAADNGDPFFMAELMKYYASKNGKPLLGIVEDNAEAVSWLRKLQDQNSHIATHDLVTALHFLQQHEPDAHNFLINRLDDVHQNLEPFPLSTERYQKKDDTLRIGNHEKMKLYKFYIMSNHITSFIQNDQKIKYAAGALLSQISLIIETAELQAIVDKSKISEALANIGHIISSSSAGPDQVTDINLVNKIIAHVNERLAKHFVLTRSTESQKLYDALKLFDDKDMKCINKCFDALVTIECLYDSKLTYKYEHPLEKFNVNKLLTELKLLTNNREYKDRATFKDIKGILEKHANDNTAAISALRHYAASHIDKTQTIESENVCHALLRLNNHPSDSFQLLQNLNTPSPSSKHIPSITAKKHDKSAPSNRYPS